MKLFNAIAAAAVIGTSFIAANPANAGNGNFCAPSSAGMEYFSMRGGGANHEFAWKHAVLPNHDGTQACHYKIISSVKHWTKYGW